VSTRWRKLLHLRAVRIVEGTWEMQTNSVILRDSHRFGI
jgi:hypothetical protein